MLNRVMLTAVKSGSGKTTITTALLNYFNIHNFNIAAFKCGPDYIDPMFHERVLNIPSMNLDPHFCDEKALKKILINSEHEYALIEGAMGIYDGFGGVNKEGSAYDVAVKTGSPIVLIVDAKGGANTLISVIKGILSDDENNMIKGLILNRVSKSFYLSFAPQIEERTGCKCIGYLEELADVSFESRHLGLKLPSEISDYKDKIDVITKAIETTIDVNALIEIMHHSAPLNGKVEDKKVYKTSRPLRIAVAKDEVFCFYYKENIDAFIKRGVEVLYFSPLHDKILPRNVDGILLGGGYPELKLKELSQNESMRMSINEAISDGMPSLAECGGFMYLLDEIIGTDNIAYKMCGVIDGEAYNTGKLSRFGYIDLKLPDGKSIKAHEFHYYDSDNNGNDCLAKKISGSREWKCVHLGDNHLWGFPHLYYPSCEELIDEFVVKMEQYNK